MGKEIKQENGVLNESDVLRQIKDSITTTYNDPKSPALVNLKLLKKF